MRRRIVMLGTAPWTKRPGGIRAVLDTYAHNGLFERWPIYFIGTHVAGGFWRKTARAGAAYLQLLLQLVGGRVALVHAHTASGASFWRKALFVLTARAFGRPVLLHLHGGGFEAFYLRQPLPLRAAIRHILGSATHIAVLTPRWQDFVHGLVSDVPVSVLPNPVDVPPSVRPVAGPPTLLFLGRVEQAKGVDELFEAVALLRRHYSSLKVVCAGHAPAAIESRLKTDGLADVVELPGWVDGAGKARLFERATVFVLPSHMEGLPVSILEAMAAGVPVVATGVGGVPDIIVDGEDGLLVPPRDPVRLAAAIEALLADAPRRARMAAAGRAKVEREYSSGKVVARLGALYVAIGGAPRVSRMKA